MKERWSTRCSAARASISRRSFRLPSSATAREREIIAAVADIYGAAAKTPYFETSLLRYEHYFAIAQELDPGARILEIGSAPGHVSVGLSLLGFELKCLNLNSLYRTSYPSREWFDRLNVIEHDFEKAALPCADGSFDAVFFTEVLEHIAIKPAVDVLRDIHRVCRAGRRLDPRQLAGSAMKQEVWDYLALPALRAEAIVKEWNARR